MRNVGFQVVTKEMFRIFINKADIDDMCKIREANKILFKKNVSVIYLPFLLFLA